MRRRCPVAFSRELGWSLLRHAEVRAVVEDHETFSNVVSTHLSVPNGMHPPRHTDFRRVIEPYFAPERVERYVPSFRSIAAELVADLPDGAGIHVCPGAPLARRELEVLLEELLAGTQELRASGDAPVRAHYPAGGYDAVPTRIVTRPR